MLGDSVRRRQPQRRQRKPSEPKSKRPSGWSWRPLLIAIPIALVVPLLLGYVLAVYVLFPPAEAAGSGIPVPRLVGLSSSDAQRELVAAGLGGLETSQLPHPDAPPGRVVAQSPLPGQQLTPGSDVRVALSAGRPRVVVPDVQGYSAERAEALLQRIGFTVQRVEQESTTPAGRVLRSEPTPGQGRELPAEIRLMVSAGPPPPPEPEPADTTWLPDGFEP